MTDKTVKNPNEYLTFHLDDKAFDGTIYLSTVYVEEGYALTLRLIDFKGGPVMQLSKVYDTRFYRTMTIPYENMNNSDMVIEILDKEKINVKVSISINILEDDSNFIADNEVFDVLMFGDAYFYTAESQPPITMEL